VADSFWSVAGPFLGAVAGALLNSIAGESYKRHKDAQALAGALAGELAGYQMGLVLARERFGTFLDTLRTYPDDAVVRYPKFTPPKDHLYESSVGKLGMLGHELAEKVAFTYQQVNAFRGIVGYMWNEGEGVDAKTARFLANEAIETMRRADAQSNGLIEALRTFSNKEWSLLPSFE
jgi:hypothetical protein